MVRATGVAFVCPACVRTGARRTRGDTRIPIEPARLRLRTRIASRRVWLPAVVVGGLLFLPQVRPRDPEASGKAFGGPVLVDQEETHVERGRLDARVEVAPAEAPPATALSVDLTWYHPLAGRRRLPGKGDRVFGAGRDGGRPECGGGHCGVDIGNSVGEVVHAASAGRVVRIVTDPDRKGGRYVKLEHAGGFASYYFHLDRVHPAMIPGIEVAAGEPVGTMGKSGIHFGRPHLHFAVTRLLDGGGEVFVDPEPMLRRAVLLDAPAEFPPGPPSRDGETASFSDGAGLGDDAGDEDVADGTDHE
ncbi:MAG TPA: M23 family metallopeptidase [Kofleriaceae bacterium]|nr:M23 family metallopeptidase [Kofleriaceae bacterium]